jgi:hypothetical protein
MYYNSSAGGSKGPARLLGRVRGVPAGSTPLPPPFVLTERQLDAEQRCQNAFQVPEAAREQQDLKSFS